MWLNLSAKPDANTLALAQEFSHLGCFDLSKNKSRNIYAAKNVFAGNHDVNDPLEFELPDDVNLDRLRDICGHAGIEMKAIPAPQG